MQRISNLKIKNCFLYTRLQVMKLIQGVIFDVDGTIYSYIENHKRALKKLCDYMEKNLNVSEGDFLKAYFESRLIIKNRLSNGGALHSRVLFFQTVLELLGKNPFCHMLKMYDLYWNEFLSEMKPFDSLTEFICKLKSCGKKIALCTDMTAHIQYRKIERLGLSKFIDFMVSSEETGIEKPSPVMFNLALKKLNITADKAAYFGDSPERDIKGSADVGIKPFWYYGEHLDEEINIDCIKIKSYREVLDSEIFFAE